MTETFTERFNTLLGNYHGSQNDLAQALNVSKQTISAWSNGNRSPKRPVIEAIARYFNVCIPWLMGLDVPLEPFAQPMLVAFDGLPARDTITDEERLLIQAYRDALPEYQAVVMDILSNHKRRADP